MNRITRTLAVLLSVASFGLNAARAADNEAALTREKAAWQAYKDGKADEFGKMISSNYQGVYADGTKDKAKEVGDMPKMKIASFSLGNFKVVATDADTETVSYTVSLDATEGGKKLPATMHAGSVWQKVGSEWQVVFHTNIGAEKK